MKELTTTFYICDYCGLKLEDKSQMELHEETCPFNPKNQPCSQCENMIVGVGCCKKINIEDIDGKKIKCFFYKKGTPRTILDALFTFDGGKED